MNQKKKNALRAVSSGARFISDVGDVVDDWATKRNHPEWYQNYPLDGLVNLNFGRRETIRPSDPNYTVSAERKAPLDAVIEVEFTTPTVKGVESPLDEAAGIILNQLRAVATTTAQYTQPDVKRYLENVRILMAAYAQLRRLADSMALADTYDSDAFYKYALMNFPFYTQWKTVEPQRAELNAGVAALTPVLRNLFPARVDIIERMKWLFSNIFIDSSSKKYSTKVFKAENWVIRDSNDAVHIFTLQREDGLVLENDDGEEEPVTVDTTTPGDTTAFGVTVHVYASTPVGMASLVRAMAGLILVDPMVSKIAGDLLKAFGQEAFMVIDPYEPGKQVPFIYDEDVLNQIQNATFAGSQQGFDCDNFCWFYGPNPTGTAQHFGDHIVTTYRDEVPGARVMAMTRLSAFLKDVTIHGTSRAEATTCGTEICSQYYYVTSEGNLPTESQYLVPHLLINASATSTEYATVAMAWASDDWAPLSYIAGGGPVLKLLDLQNWTTMSEEDMAIFTNIATLSLYCIPYLVKKQDTFAFVN